MKIAVEGCCHGELDKIYETLLCVEKKHGISIDLLLICGDFQAVRNRSDMQCMAVPQKYQKMNTFYKYYSGEKKAPFLTLFVGGNHEASNYLQELPYGGWVAPNIYYMGYANVLNFGGLRIGGLSGISKPKDFHKGHFEHPPYTDESVRSAYHVRNLEIFRLKQLSKPLDIFLSHDWPRGIYDYGNIEQLKRHKPFLVEEMNKGILGSEPAQQLLHTLQPAYWFAAHLHTKFAAVIQHQDANTTKFLALDKCLPRRKFLQVLDLPGNPDAPKKLQLDPEWLVILKSTNHLLSLSRTPTYMPGPGGSERWDFKVTIDQENQMRDDFGGDLTLPENFERTVPVFDPSHKVKHISSPTTMVNPQTTLLCTMLDITDPNAVFLGRDSSFSADSSNLSLPDAEGCNSDEDDGDDDTDEDNLDEELEVTGDSEPSFIDSERSFSLQMSSLADDSADRSLLDDGKKEEEDEFHEIMAAQKRLKSLEDVEEEFEEIMKAQQVFNSTNNSQEEEDEEASCARVSTSGLNSEAEETESVSSNLDTGEKASSCYSSEEDCEVSGVPERDTGNSCGINPECMEAPSDHEFTFNTSDNTGKADTAERGISNSYYGNKTRSFVSNSILTSPMKSDSSSQSEDDKGEDNEGEEELEAFLDTRQRRKRIPVSKQIELSVKALHKDTLLTLPDVKAQDSMLSSPTALRPLTKASPASSEERSDTEVTLKTDRLVLSGKRTDGSENEDSPQSKKFKRRNQELYSLDSAT